METKTYQESMTTLRQGPYPGEPVRIWSAVALLSLFFGLPLLSGRRGDSTTPPD